MLFKISQRGRRKETAWREARLKQAVSFFARSLNVPRPKYLDISLLMSSAKLLVEDGEHGNCKPLYHDLIKGNPCHFKITIQRDMPWSWTIKTFAHEMVHVQQYATGRLRHKWDIENSIWLRSWENGAWIDKKTIPYPDRPWEIEARAKEGPLSEGFFKIEEATGISYGG